MHKKYLDPAIHPSGIRAPKLAEEMIPRHIALVMDGNGRWANKRSLPRTEGHAAGEKALLEVIAGALELGVKALSAFAFSTENWSRSPAEVRFLMGFSRTVLRRQRDILNSWGVKIVWIGRSKRLWPSVIKELRQAEELTKDNDRLTLYMCVNYGGRAEITDAVKELAHSIQAGKINPGKISEKTISQKLYDPNMPEVDLFIRTSGEQRISNFLLWQSAYAELVFVEQLWPDMDRIELFKAVEQYVKRERRFGGAVDQVK